MSICYKMSLLILYIVAKWSGEYSAMKYMLETDTSDVVDMGKHCIVEVRYLLSMW